MSYQIKYTDKWSGQTRIHEYSGHQAGAEAWTRGLSQDNNGCRTECVEIDSGHYQPENRGRVTHVLTIGDDNKKR